MQQTLQQIQLSGHQTEQKNQKENSKKQEPSKENSAVSQLFDQMKEFRKQADSQQKQSEEQLEKSISEAMGALEQANNQIKSNHALLQMNQFINQAQAQLSNMENKHQGQQGDSDTEKTQVSSSWT